MARIRGMMACSLDGFAADAGGGVGWLDAFGAADWGYDAFIAEIGTVVMGRVTMQQAVTLSPDWPYPGKRAIVVGRDLPARLPGDASGWDRGVPSLITHLRGLADGDVWVVGGPMLQAAFIAAGALDRLQLCIVPHLLGQGIRVFPEGDPGPRRPVLDAATTLPMGMVMLDYSFG
jgi:dihydrofolate reductase